jgi:GNAT superfamily N-acetyltransferase
MVCVGLQRQTSYLCDNPDCCPPEGRPIADARGTVVEASLVGAGSAPLPGRADLVAQLAARDADDPVLLAVRRESERVFIRLTAGLVERTDRFVADLRGWAGSPRDARARTRLVATVGHLVATIPSRDLLLRSLTVEPDHRLLKLARDVLAEAVRCAEPGQVATLAAALGVCCWVDGDGASTWVALDRAFADDPDHSLAGLVALALEQGQPPWAWTAIMAELSVEEILASARRDPTQASR